MQNALFPTWALNQIDHGFAPLAVPAVAAANGAQALWGDVDVDALERALAANPGTVSFVCVETSTNALGGLPLSLANLRRVRAAADAHGVPLVLDATRVLENAAFVAGHEDGERGRKVWEVAEEILALATAVTLGLSKDFGIDHGGLVATDDSRLAELLHEDVLRRGREPGVAQRRLMAAALADRERSAAAVAERMGAVRELRRILADAGLPVVAAGGHCVLIDAARLPGADRSPNPAADWLAWSYRHTGVRAAPHLAAGPAAGAALVRLAVPLGLGTERAAEAAAGWRRCTATGARPRCSSRPTAPAPPRTRRPPRTTRPRPSRPTSAPRWTRATGP